MTRARARSLWLAWPAFVAACSSSANTVATTTSPSPSSTSTTIAQAAATTPTSTTTTPADTVASAAIAPASTLAPVDPSLLIPLALGNKAFPAPGDELASQHKGFTGDPNATLQAWLITPMAVPSGPDVRLLGFSRTVGTNSTTATFLTGSIDPQAVLTTIATALAPSSTYTLTPSTRTEGSATIHGFDAQPSTVEGTPPGWSVEASAVDQLGIVRITRNDYTFDKVVPTFDDLPSQLQPQVANQDAIAVTIGGVLSSINYEYGVASLGDVPAHRTRLSYDLASDFPTATDRLAGRLTTGWDENEQPDAVTFTSTTTTEIWTLDDFGGTTHLTYDTGS
ncbi:MAG: hypothetical protein ACXVH5_13130 [Ilumatobacteraceae bacterium]